MEEVRAHRGQYVADVLTIILAWRNAGCPRTDVLPIATYGGAWADYCRHPLIWLGLPDPATSLLSQLTHDPDAETLGRLLALWQAKFHFAPSSIADAIRVLPADCELMDIFREIAEVGGKINNHRLGKWFKKHQGRIVDGRELRSFSASGGRNLWKVVGGKNDKSTRDYDEEFLDGLKVNKANSSD